ncbi:MAG TPA: hypothetical protein VFL91_18175 [Thermomicrobiales bacterium]|nr:hypothetical protein [Thermomicrobiales bacterium]
MDKLIVGLAIVDQMDDEKRMKALAEALVDQAPVPGHRVRAAAARVLVALARRLAPEIASPATPQPAAGGARS